MEFGPDAAPGARIGLLGGSFDPPHEGHLLIARQALRRFRLSCVWLLVSPGNPLKRRGPADLGRRLAACRAMTADEPRLVPTGIEAALGTAYTAETLAALRRLHPGVRYTWLMGADNFATFHLWQDWRWIAETVPLGIFARPGWTARAARAPAARAYREARLRGAASWRLATLRAPAWALVTGPTSPASSSAIRAGGGWP